MADVPALATEARPRDESGRLDTLFAALSDPVRRSILERLDGRDLLVSELAAAYAISLQVVSRHIQVLVNAGLVRQARGGRISRCSLEAGPIAERAAWINRYSKYWQAQFETLAARLLEIEKRRGNCGVVRITSGIDYRRINIMESKRGCVFLIATSVYAAISAASSEQASANSKYSRNPAVSPVKSS